MDAGLKGKIYFLGKQNKTLASSAGDATNYYNNLVSTHFDRKFWTAAGLSGGVSALLAKAVIPTAPVISAIPEAIATTSTELATVGGSTALSTVGGSTALSTATVGAAATSTELALSDVIITGEGVEVLTGMANSAALAGATEVTTTGAATGAAAAGGGAAASAALPYIAIGIAAYAGGKILGESIGKLAYARQGQKMLKELKTNVNSLKGYCDSMIRSLNLAINNLNNASNYISVAEKKIAKQQYNKKIDNLYRIRERQAEVIYTYMNLRQTISIIKEVKANLEKIA